MNTMKLGLIFAVAGAAACGSPYGRQYRVMADPAFTPAEMDSLMAAVEDWRSRVPVDMEVVVTDCAGIPDKAICVHRSNGVEVATISEKYGTPPLKAGRVEAGITIAKRGGFGEVDGGEVWVACDVVETAASPYLQTTFGHELGHAMGLLHQGGRVLMNPYDDEAASTVQPADVEQWWSFR